MLKRNTKLLNIRRYSSECSLNTSERLSFGIDNKPAILLVKKRLVLYQF